MSFQYRLTSLLTVMAFVAFACVALSTATPFWSRLVHTFAVAAFASAGLFAWNQNGTRRAFWGAFAFVGVAYFIIGNVEAFSELRERLLTTTLVRSLSEAMVPHAYVRDGRGVITGFRGDTYYRFLEIGHAVWAIVIGLLFGWLSRYFYDTRKTTSETETSDNA